MWWLLIVLVKLVNIFLRTLSKNHKSLNFFYIIMWIVIYLLSRGPCCVLHVLWLNLLCSSIFIAHVMVFVINYYEELLHSCVHIAHVEASCFGLLCRPVIYLCYVLLCFGFSFKLLCEIIGTCCGL